MGIHAPVTTRVDVVDSVRWASPVMRSSMLEFMGVRAVARSVVLRVGGLAEYKH